ncbi:MAG: hypothetical protein ACTSYL_05250, partial [Candidatus Thorarchaeota archaeon]
YVSGGYTLFMRPGDHDRGQHKYQMVCFILIHGPTELAPENIEDWLPEEKDTGSLDTYCAN